MSIGPVEYIIVGFPGNQFNGDANRIDRRQDRRGR